MHTVDQLKAFRPTQASFIGIDSDGCVFDSMELKHKECFCPAFVDKFGLQAVGKYARETWEFVNLYSRTRGCNRFHAVLHALDYLRERPEVRSRGQAVPELSGLRTWVRRESRLGNPALEAEVARTDDPDLKTALAWSLDVNAAVKKIVRDVPPFPLVRESLLKARQAADVFVVSQTPTEALAREWKEHDLDGFVAMIAGQELGTKSEHIAYAAKGKYASERILMVGDALGDLAAARENGVLFYPILPGREEESWQRFHDEAAERFFGGTYAGAYAAKLGDEFERRLPAEPAWRR
jgi:phosphoglycolate phosphatase-like HAD superfamily hydrolase